MTKFKKVGRGDPFDFPAGLHNGLVDLLNGAEATGVGSIVRRAAQGVIVKVKNTSGADRAQWETMALETTLRFTLGTDGKESVIFNAIASDPTKPPAILQEPIKNGKFGDVLIFGYTLARVAAGTATILAAKPNASNKLKPDPSGTVRLLAAPSAGAETVLPCIIGFGTGGGTGIAKSPSTGIAARSGDAAGVAVCNLAELWDDAGTVRIREKSPPELWPIYNTTISNIGASTWIHWKTEGDRKIIDVDDC